MPETEFGRCPRGGVGGKSVGRIGGRYRGAGTLAPEGRSRTAEGWVRRPGGGSRAAAVEPQQSTVAVEPQGGRRQSSRKEAVQENR